MSLTYPAAFVVSNAADTATITASAALTLTPASLLQDQHVGRKWRAETDTASLTIALASSFTIDSIGLFGLNLTTAAITRIRASLTDVSAVDGAVYDSGSAAGRVSSYYGNLVALMSSSASARYIRIDLSESGLAYIEAGFLVIGLKSQVATNFTPGATDTLTDSSIKTKSRSGATWIDSRPKFRTWSFNFDFLTETERMGFIEDIEHLLGQSSNLMMIRDCSSTNLGRDSICGLLAEDSAIVSRGFLGDGPAFSKSYKIEQRL